MDIVFNCSKCDQELAIDSAETGSKIDCPTCGTTLTVPAATDTNVQVGGAAAVEAETTTAPVAQAVPVAQAGPPAIVVATASLAKPAAAPAHEEKHFSVPQRTGPAVPFIEKPKPVLETAAHVAGRIKVKTIKHGDCIEVGKDKFDDIVTDYIAKVGHENIISITPLNYSHVEHGAKLLLTDYALMIIYKT